MFIVVVALITYCEPEENCANLSMAITLSIRNQSVKVFHCCKEQQISNKIHISLPTTL